MNIYEIKYFIISTGMKDLYRSQIKNRQRWCDSDWCLCPWRM